VEGRTYAGRRILFGTTMNLMASLEELLDAKQAERKTDGRVSFS
jgi:hypothetical protein